MTRFTVAVPTMNGARHLADALQSVLHQTHQDFDLLLSDDRSDDDTLAVALRILGDRGAVHVNAKRHGLAGNWNQCLALSPNRWVAILHQDDAWRPDHLALHAAAIARQPDCGLVASACRVIDDDGAPVPPTVVEPGGLCPVGVDFAPGEALASLAAANPLRCSAVTLDAHAVRELGGFDPAWRYVVDWDLWLRLARVRPVVWLAEPTLLMRWHLGSETHRFARGNLDLQETERLVHRTFDWLRDAGQPTHDVVSANRRRLARAYLNRAHVALKQSDPQLARRCLFTAIRRQPTLLLNIARDPRLTAQMLGLTVTPGLATKVFARRSQ